MDIVRRSRSVAKLTVQYIFLQALLLIPVLAWNSVIQNAINKTFPEEDFASVWMSLLYAIVITVLAVALFLILPLREAEHAMLGVPL